MKRREFISLLGGAVAAWPLAVRAQQPAMPVIGFLSSRSPDPSANRRSGIPPRPEVKSGSSKVETWRSNTAGRRADMIGCRRWRPNLVRRPVTVIVASAPPAALAAKAATSTIPIVFSGGIDPVSWPRRRPQPAGRQRYRSHPVQHRAGGKAFRIAARAGAQATVLALLVNPTFPGTDAIVDDMRTAARTLGVRLNVLNASSETTRYRGCECRAAQPER